MIDNQLGVPRFGITIEIWDNDNKDYVYEDDFNADDLGMIEAALEQALEEVQKARRRK